MLEGSLTETKTIRYSSRTWEIGSSDAGFRSLGYPRTFNGIIDEVEAFRVALPQATIEAIYNKRSVGECKDPVIVTPSSETFAPQTVRTTSPAKTVTVINNRNIPITINDSTFGGADTGDFAQATTTCGSSLSGRKSCKVGVTFTPEATGKRTATLNVNDTATGSPHTVGLTGTGK